MFIVRLPISLLMKSDFEKRKKSKDIIEEQFKCSKLAIVCVLNSLQSSVWNQTYTYNWFVIGKYEVNYVIREMNVVTERSYGKF